MNHEDLEDQMEKPDMTKIFAISSAMEVLPAGKELGQL
jgi:hypothetical protein